MDQDQQAVDNFEDKEDSTLRWADVEKFAKDLFKVWCNGSELKWAETAWGHLANTGYANGKDGKEYCRARLRFLALATLYADWYFLTDEVESDPEVQYYAEALELNPFYLGLLLGPDYEVEEPEEEEYYPSDDDKTAIENALRELVRRERPVVAKALIAGFGSPGEIFVSLWRTRYPAIEQQEEQDGTSHTQKAAVTDEAKTVSGQQLQLLTEDSVPEGDEDEDDEEEEDEYDEATLSDEEILNDVTAENLAVWSWIDEGCRSLD